MPTTTSDYVQHDCLPDKLSTLMQWAADDIRILQNDSDYVIEPTICWHQEITQAESDFNSGAWDDLIGKCLVCVAGCLLVGRYSLPQHCVVIMDDLPDAVAAKLRAISDMSEGYVIAAVIHFYGDDKRIELKHQFREIESQLLPMPEYPSDPVRFLTVWGEIIDDLQELGL